MSACRYCDLGGHRSGCPDENRIAQLTAELAEARKASANHEASHDSTIDILAEERAAHECTKGELAEARRDLEAWQTEASLCRDTHFTFDRVVQERDAARAEVTELLEALKIKCRKHDIFSPPSYYEWVDAKVKAALDGTAGRDLAARLTKLEAVAKAARRFRRYTIEGKALNKDGRIACIDTAPEELNDALAALDGKGDADVE